MNNFEGNIGRQEKQPDVLQKIKKWRNRVKMPARHLSHSNQMKIEVKESKYSLG